MATRQQQNTTPIRTISDFKSRLSGGGARPNLFEVELAFPNAVAIDNDVLQKSRFLVKAAALPASTIAPIDVPFRGRILKIAGDRTFETWTITVLNDTDFSIRSAFIIVPSVSVWRCCCNSSGPLVSMFSIASA